MSILLIVGILLVLLGLLVPRAVAAAYIGAAVLAVVLVLALVNHAPLY